MPFIGSKVTVKISPEKEKTIKERLGKAIELIPGKSETFLMVGFEDEYKLYFAGEKLEKGAFIEEFLRTKSMLNMKKLKTGDGMERIFN